MVATTFDFAILGDSEPEGLLAAAGLTRKGYSVCVVPSSLLDELPAEDVFPLQLPVQLGSKRLDDLLFRAGFFRLEESGLVSSPFTQQILMQKSRWQWNGSEESWRQEMNREFPWAATTLNRWIADVKNLRGRSPLRLIQDLMDLQKKDPTLRRFLQACLHTQVRPMNTDSKESWRGFFQFVAHQGSRVYRVDPKLSQSYIAFLMEHARKWGVQVFSGNLQLKSQWSGFHLSSETKSKYVIINSLGGGRALMRTTRLPLSDRYRYWLYLDRLDLPLEQIPEPLAEISDFSFEDEEDPILGLRRLYVQRDHLRQEAHLILASWLPYDDQKSWTLQIEKGRKMLKGFLPFLPESSFKQIPPLLELTELRGECVRRGQIDRLLPMPASDRSWKASLKRWLPKKPRKHYEVSRRIFVLNPHYLPFRNRFHSFGASLAILDDFEREHRRFSKT